MSNTSTLNEQSAVLLEASVALKVTVVLPTSKLDPELGPAICATVAPGQLSAGVGVVKLAFAAHEPVGALTVISAGQAIVGF